MKKHSLMSFFIFLFLAVLLSGCSTSNKAVVPNPNREQSKPLGMAQNSASENKDAAQTAADTAADSQLAGEPADKSQERPMPMIIDKTKSYKAVLSTDAGDIEIELTASQTPITANNFVSLAKKNFYDGTIFHRVIKGFMIQGGDPEGTGMGGPGYKFDDEPFEGDYTRGTVAMANAGPDTNGSQYFIMHEERPLPKNYVIFGKVASGMDVVDKIAESEVEMSPSGEMSKPVNPVKVNSIKIIEE